MPALALIAGHTDSVLCCEVLPDNKLLASGGEDGAICLTDLTTLKPAGRIQQSVGDAVPSLRWHPSPGQEHCLFAAAGPAVLQLDLRRGTDASAVLRSFAAGTEEVNSLAVSGANGGWLAAGDDSGEVQVISLQQQQQQQGQEEAGPIVAPRVPVATGAGAVAVPSQASATAAATAPRVAASVSPTATPAGAGAASTSSPPPPSAAAAAPAPVRPSSYKTLRRGHTNICSAVAFRPHRPWELLSGGLDSTVVRWDFSRLRPLHTWNLNGEVTASGGQLFNPPMVHSIAVPQAEERGICSLMALARGDGCVALYDADSRGPPVPGSTGSGSGRSGGSSSKKGGRARHKAGSQQRSIAAAGVPGRLVVLGSEQGGHTAAVNCASFVRQSDWRQLLSAGNDRRLLLWNWQVALDAAQAAAEVAVERGESATASTSLHQGCRQGQEQQEEEGQAGGQQMAAAAAEGTDGGTGGPPLLAAEHQHGRKINWACSVDLPGCPFNVVLADTGRRLTALSLP